MEGPKEYGREYVTQAGTTFLDPIGGHPDLGEMLNLIINKYPEIQGTMEDLLIKEGPQAYGDEAMMGDVGLIETLLGKHFWTDKRTPEELSDVIQESIAGLKTLEYVTGYPTLTNSGMIGGEYLHGETPTIRMNPEVPDTAFYETPASFEYGEYNPDTMQRERMYKEYTTEDALKTLLHESLLHGMNIWHPTNPFVSGASARNYHDATNEIYDILSEEDKAAIVDLMFPDYKKEPQPFYYP